MECTTPVECLSAIDFSAVEGFVSALGATAIGIAVIWGGVMIVTIMIRRVSRLR